jgi:hypothetical protein
MYPYVASKMTNSNLFQKIQKNTKNTKISKKYKNFQKKPTNSKISQNLTKKENLKEKAKFWQILAFFWQIWLFLKFLAFLANYVFFGNFWILDFIFIHNKAKCRT